MRNKRFKRVRLFWLSAPVSAVPVALFVSAFIVSIGLAGCGDRKKSQGTRAQVVVPITAISPALERELLVVTTTGTVTPPGVGREMSVCSARNFVGIPIATEDWLRLTAVVDPAEASAYRLWLQAPSGTNLSLSNDQLLAKIWQAIGRALTTLATDPKSLPRVVEIRWVLAPRDCRYVEERKHTEKEARDTLVVPLPFVSFLPDAPELSAQMIESIARLTAHEGVHVLQLSPLSAASARTADGWLKIFVNPMPRETTVRYEFQAALIDTCITLALFGRSYDIARGPGSRVKPDLLNVDQARRQAIASSAPGSPAGRGDIYEIVDAKLREVLGPDLPNLASPRALRSMFPVCTMHLRRDFEPTDRVALSQQETEIGLNTLDQMLTLSLPIRFQSAPPVQPPSTPIPSKSAPAVKPEARLQERRAPAAKVQGK